MVRTYEKKKNSNDFMLETDGLTLWKEKNSDDFMLETDGLTLWIEKKFHWKLLYNLNLKQ
jgi:hypothetical protein